MTDQNLAMLICDHSRLDYLSDTLEEDTLLSDICDSLDFACIFTALEEEMGITIDSTTAMKLSKGTYRDLLNMVEMVMDYSYRYDQHG